jgi:phosphate/phosphite/phosphonate ABC transporter binding protein
MKPAISNHFHYRALLFVAALASILLPTVGSWAGDRVKIGVLAKRGPEKCLKKWGPTAKYLSASIPEKTFAIIPLGFDQILPAVEKGEIDFVLANSSFYVSLELGYGVDRIATLKNKRLDGTYTTFGGVILALTKRKDIRTLQDLKGMAFMAVEENSFGGWQTAWRELKEEGIDPEKDFSNLSFGGTHDAVVYAVLNGQVDAGTVRTDTLERMQLEGKVKLSDFHVIHEHGGGKFHAPFLHSTREYPEWPMAKVKHTPIELAEQVAVKLIEMPEESPAATSASCAGWTIPLQYQSVHDCLKYLKVGPYEDFGKITYQEVLKRYWPILSLTLVLFVVLTLSTGSFIRLSRKLRSAKIELEESHNEVESLVEGITSIMIGLSPEGRILRWNKKAQEVFGVQAQDALGQYLANVAIPWNWEEIRDQLEACVEEARQISLNNVPITRMDGKEGFLGLKLDPIEYTSGGESSTGVLIMGADITERRLLELQLAQAQKLESIGQLAAGIAHEINTPSQYVGDNTRFLQEACSDIFEVLQVYQGLIRQAKNDALSKDDIESAEEQIEEFDLDYLIEEIPVAIEQSLDGVNRISSIVGSMKEFSHPGVEDKILVDINKSLQSTITVARNEWKYVAELETDLETNLPHVLGYPGKLNQVFLNIIINAAHAIEGSLAGDRGMKGKIEIRTRDGDGVVEIRLKDTGGGIPEEIRHRIFDPFFTTKEVGKGTGQGLAIAHSVITDEHGGTIELETVEGEGSTFIINLPLEI